MIDIPITDENFKKISNNGEEVRVGSWLVQEDGKFFMYSFDFNDPREVWIKYDAPDAYKERCEELKIKLRKQRLGKLLNE